jgi:DNA-binding ferritin-like protein
LSVPASFIDDLEYWRKRAEEARTIAERMTDAHTKSLMLGVAESYEKIAKWAAKSTGEPNSNAE